MLDAIAKGIDPFFDVIYTRVDTSDFARLVIIGKAKGK